MIAALPMYDWPEERDRTDALWRRIRDALRDTGIDAPETLTRGDDLFAQWRDPDLVLGQTCGLPYATLLQGDVGLVGTLRRDLPKTSPGFYHSVLVSRADDGRSMGDLTRARIAINQPDSQSGWGALAGWADSKGYALTRPRTTGSHRASAAMVADDGADLASLDAVSWDLVTRHDPDVASTLTLRARTTPTPALPLITARRFDPDRIAAAIETALGPGALIRHAPDAYFAVPRFEFPAET